MPETTQIFAHEIETFVRLPNKPSITPPKTTIPSLTIKKSSDGIRFLKLFALVILVVCGIVFAAKGFGNAARFDGTAYVANTSIPKTSVNQNSVSNEFTQNLKRISQSPPRNETNKVSQPPPKIETPPVYQPPPIKLPTPKPKTTIADSTFHISTSSWRWFNFTLIENSRVTGRFSAKGGTNNIECLVLSEMDFINWSNSNQYRRYYDSGIVTVGKIDLTLAPGNYVLVFYNRTIFDNKTVETKVEIE